MKFPRTILVGLLGSTLLIALPACEKAKSALGMDKESKDATAKSLRQVRVVRVNANNCEGGISAGLSEYGFSTVGESEEKVDATLSVSVKHTGRNLDDVPNFGGFGNEASYSATLRGAKDKVLFSTSGKEGSITLAEMCGDIGDEIGERLQHQKG